MLIILLFFFFRKKNNISVLDSILNAPPTAELEPLQDGKYAQLDEVDMGMTYNELNYYRRLRKQHFAGPFSMYCRLITLWDNCTPKEVLLRCTYAVKEDIKLFFFSFFF